MTETDQQSRAANPLILGGFWIGLLTASGLYAAVSLTPRYLALQELRQEHRSSQERLVALEQQTAFLRKTVAALESGSELAIEMARRDFGQQEAVGERIKVDDTPLLTASLASPQVDRSDSANTIPRWQWNAMAWLTPLATDRQLRQRMLLAAAMLTMFIFVCLTPYQSVRTSERRSKRSLIARLIPPRYRSVQ